MYNEFSLYLLYLRNPDHKQYLHQSLKKPADAGVQMPAPDAQDAGVRNIR